MLTDSAAMAPLELLLPDDGFDAILRRLRERFTLTVDPPETLERVFLDTFDGRLRREGLVLERSDGRLRLREGDRPDRVAGAPAGREDRVLASELPQGPLRDRLAPLLENRAALPLAPVSSQLQRVRVLNDDEKTVVRLVVDAPAGLEPRVVVQPVLGYDKALVRVRSALEDLGLAAAPEPLVDRALAAAGHDPRGVSTKVDVALSAGMRADAAMLAVCRRLADVVEATLPGTLDDLDPEFLHDFRVAVRRTRSMLRELEGVLPPADAERAAEDLRWVQRITGPARDLDVQLEEWDELLAALAPGVAHDLAPLHALLLRKRVEALREMRHELRGHRFARAWRDWRAVLERPLPEEPDEDRPRAATPLGELAGRRIRRVYGRMVALGSAIDDDSPAEDLHKLRKRGKELRYLLEFFGGLFPREEVKPMVSALKELQDVLGRFQDREVQAEFLRSLGSELAQESRGADALIALGMVIDRLHADQADARDAFHDRFDAFAAKKRRRRVEKVFAS